MVEFLAWDADVAAADEPGKRRFDVYDIPDEPQVTCPEVMLPRRSLPLLASRTAMNASGLPDGNDTVSPDCDADPSVGT